MKTSYTRAETRRWAFTEADLLILLRAEVARVSGVAPATEKPLAEAWTLEVVQVGGVSTVTVVQRYDYPKPLPPVVAKDLNAVLQTEHIMRGLKSTLG